MKEQGQTKTRLDLSRLRINRDKEVSQPYIKPSIWTVGIIFIAAIIIVTAVYGLGWLSFFSPEVEVEIVSVQGGSSGRQVLTANGYVVAQRQASLSSKGTGRLEYLAVREGDRVKKDEIICYLEQDKMKAELSRSRAELGVEKALLEEEKANLKNAEREWIRQKELLKNNFTAQADYDVAETKVEVLKKRVASAAARVKSAEAQLRIAEVNLENTIIRAPFNGTIIRKDAEIGEIIAIAPLSGSVQAHGAVVTIADLTSLEVEVDVNERHIARIVVGQPAEIILDAFPARHYRAEVRQIAHTADRQKATVKVKVKFLNLDDRILPEMGAKVVFLDKSTSVDQMTASKILIPKKSIRRDDNGNKIVLIVSDQKIETRIIQTGSELNGKVEVKSGLSGGEYVVVSGPTNLTDGVDVKIKGR